MNGPKWTTEREEKLLALWNEGHSGDSCARLLGISRNAVMGKLSRIGGQKRGGYATKTVRIAPHNVSMWTPEMDAKIVAWYRDQQESPETIAGNMDLARSTIVRRLKILGVPIRGRNKGQICRLGPKRPKDAKPLPRRQPGASVFECLGESVDLMSLTAHSCRWPQELNGETRYCGRQKDHGSYCYHHAQMALRPRDDRPHKARPGVDFRPKQLMNGRVY